MNSFESKIFETLNFKLNFNEQRMKGQFSDEKLAFSSKLFDNFYGHLPRSLIISFNCDNWCDYLKNHRSLYKNKKREKKV